MPVFGARARFVATFGVRVVFAYGVTKAYGHVDGGVVDRRGGMSQADDPLFCGKAAVRRAEFVRRGRMTPGMITRLGRCFTRLSRMSGATIHRSCVFVSRVSPPVWASRISLLLRIGLGWPRCGGVFDVPEPAVCGGRERECAELVSGWEHVKCGWFAGDMSRVVRWAPGCVVRVAIGGVGGRHGLGPTPEPALWFARSDVVCDHRNVRGLPIEFADTRGDA